MLLVSDGTRDDIGEELEVFNTGDCVGYGTSASVSKCDIFEINGRLTDIAILDVPPRFLRVLRFDLIIGLLDEVLQEHFGRDCDAKGGVVAAIAGVWVYVDDFLHSCHCSKISPCLLYTKMRKPYEAETRCR